MDNRILAIAIAVAMALFGYRADAGPILDAVKARGQLLCGVSTGGPGFMQADKQGKWTGFSVDICHAVSGAILGDATKVKYVPLEPNQRFPALQAGQT